jgi:hypothetical protein
MHPAGSDSLSQAQRIFRSPAHLSRRSFDRLGVRYTAALGLILVPLPPILNAVGAVLSVTAARSLSLPPPTPPKLRKFDLATGRPILGYDSQTGQPILGDHDD